MIIERLANHPSANCHIVVDPEIITFVSYSTDVIIATRVVDNIWMVRCTGTYSQTTRRQISWFLREYFPNLTYYDMKKIAGTKVYVQGLLK